LLKRVRPLDAAIAVVILAIVLVGGYFAYSVYANNMALRTGSPANREIEAFRQALKKNPNDLETRMRLAQALSVAGRGREAVQQYEAVLKIRKDWVPALSGIGFELLKQKEWKRGEDYFVRVVKLTEATAPTMSGSSSYEIANYYVGVAKMEQRDYSGAVGYLREALRSRRDASDTAYALAVCYEKLNVKDGQRDMLAYTLEFDPKMPEANYDYGKLLLADGDVASAAEHFRISATSAPYKQEPKDELAKLGKVGDRLADANKLASTDASAALAQARIAAAIDPESVDALLLSGRLYEKLKKKDSAASVYEKVLLIDPSNATAKAGLKRVTDES
jgi:Tfp pilus assembly protein PilF